MKSLQRRFNNISKQNPYWGSWTCFAGAVRDQEFSKRTISKHFNALVEKDDYDKRDKKELIKNLLSLSQNITEESMF